MATTPREPQKRGPAKMNALEIEARFVAACASSLMAGFYASGIKHTAAFAVTEANRILNESRAQIATSRDGARR